MLNGSVVTVTAYEAFGRLQVLITEQNTTQNAHSYRLVANESIALVETATDGLADALSQLGVVLWQASERVSSSPI